MISVVGNAAQWRHGGTWSGQSVCANGKGVWNHHLLAMGSLRIRDTGYGASR